MGEYKDIEGQIARVRNAYSTLFGLTLTQTSLEISIDDDLKEGPFCVEIGDWAEHRPTLAGALLAIELRLDSAIEDRVKGLKRLQELRATLKLPELPIGGAK